MSIHPRHKKILITNDDNSDEDTHSLEEGFYEVEEIVERRLNRDAVYEYKVRFKNYGPADDMWLPSSCLNSAIHFSSTSRYGRKRTHVAAPPLNDQVQAKLKKTNVNKVNLNSESTKDKQSHGNTNVGEEKAKRLPRQNVRKKRNTNKGFLFRQSLTAKKLKTKTKKAKRQSSDGSASDTPKVHNVESESHTSAHLTNRTLESTDVTFVDETSVEMLVIKDVNTSPCYSDGTCNDSNSFKSDSPVIVSDEEFPDIVASGMDCSYILPQDDHIVHDLMRKDDNFRTPRRILAEVYTPPVDISLDLAFVLKADFSSYTDTLKATCIPPNSRIQKALQCLQKHREKEKSGMSIDGYGTFSQEGLHVLLRYHRMKEIKMEVQTELT
jgi:hypothetical protein